MVFPPLQWATIIIVLIFKSFDTFNSEEEIKLRKSKSSISDLVDLKNKGLISENELKQKIEKLEDDEIDIKIKQSDEYKKLKGLFESRILTKEEFDNKVRILFDFYNPNNLKPNTIEENPGKETVKEFEKAEVEKQPFLDELIELFSFEGRIKGFIFFRRIVTWFLIVGTFSSVILINLENFILHKLFSFIIVILHFWFWFAQGAKRCHDLGKSGWWQFVPFYIFWMLFQKGEYYNNQYGSPRT